MKLKLNKHTSCYLTLLLPCFLIAEQLQDRITIESPFIDTCRALQSYQNSYFSSLGEFLRDKYFIPLNQMSPAPAYLKDSEQHAIRVMEMLKSKQGPYDPTFSNFAQIASEFTVRDIPIEIQSTEKTYRFRTRVLESVKDQKFRIILFSFNQNQEQEDDKWVPWNPTSCAEIGASSIEVLKALKQHIEVDSMMCVSLGGITFDALQYLEEDCLPKNLIWNRGLTSTWKAGQSLGSYPLNCFLYYATRYYGLYANPEDMLLNYCEKVEQKRLVVIEAKEDHYFSGDAGLSPEFFEGIHQTGVELYNAKFQVPLLHPRAHHACRLDWIIHHDAGSEIDNFFQMLPCETLSDCIARHLFMSDEKGHTCLIIGGSLDTLNSMVYLHALPLLSSLCKLQQES